MIILMINDKFTDIKHFINKINKTDDMVQYKSKVFSQNMIARNIFFIKYI